MDIFCIILPIFLTCASSCCRCFYFSHSKSAKIYFPVRGVLKISLFSSFFFFAIILLFPFIFHFKSPGNAKLTGSLSFSVSHFFYSAQLLFWKFRAFLPALCTCRLGTFPKYRLKFQHFPYRMGIFFPTSADPLPLGSCSTISTHLYQYSWAIFGFFESQQDLCWILFFLHLMSDVRFIPFLS